MSSMPSIKFIFCNFAFLLLWVLSSCENTKTIEDALPSTPKDSITTSVAPITTPAVEPRQVFTSFSFGACNSMEEGGCYCTYKAKGTDNKAPSFFVADKNHNVCVKVNDQWQELLHKDNASEEALYYNESYQVILAVQPIPQLEHKPTIYEGDLILKDKEGNILHTQPVSGTCNC